MVVALLLAALGTIYGLSALWFIWWNGGLVRRTLIVLCAIAIALATWYAIDTDRIEMPRSSVTRDT